MLTGPTQCPKCCGLLAYDYEIHCLNCGYRRYEAPKNPTHCKPAKKKSSTNPRTSPSSSSLNDTVILTGKSGLRAAYDALSQLEAPFIRKIEDRGLLGMTPLPCFFFDREYTEATKGIFGKKKDTALDRWVKIKEAILHFPLQTRTTIWRLLRQCDSQTREGTKYCDVQIETFLNTITQERQRLDTLRKAESQSTLFPFSLHDSLLRYCDAVQEQLDRARVAVKEARTSLEPAKKFFLNQRSPTRREAKKMLLAMCMKRPSIDKKKAAKLVSTLLNLADPKRPTTPGAIRQLGYDRYRPGS